MKSRLCFGTSLGGEKGAAWAVLALCAVLVFPRAEAADKPLRVATYNLRNYLSMDRLLEDGFRRDYPKPEAEKEVVRATIIRVAPDILALQEVGEEGYLLELKEDLAREGLSYSGFAIAEAADESRRVAALWRGGLRIEAVGHTDLDLPYLDGRVPVRRGMLQLVIRDESGRPLMSLFNLHLKSKFTDDVRDPQSERRRVGEAQAARDRILELHPDTVGERFLIVGDLNDGPNSSAVRRFLRRGELEIARALDCRDSHGMVWTHYWAKGGLYSQIDYILYSAGWSEWDSVDGFIEDWPSYYEGSDHRLVWADLPGVASLASMRTAE